MKDALIILILIFLSAAFAYGSFWLSAALGLPSPIPEGLSIAAVTILVILFVPMLWSEE